jgi:hypothetical protein
MSAEERHFWQPEIHVLASFGFAALVWYVCSLWRFTFRRSKGSEKVRATKVHRLRDRFGDRRSYQVPEMGRHMVVLETVRNEGNSLRYGGLGGPAASSAVEMHMIVSGD